MMIIALLPLFFIVLGYRLKHINTAVKARDTNRLSMELVLLALTATIMAAMAYLLYGNN